MGNQTAWAMAAVVVTAVVAVLAYQYMQQQAAAARARDPATLIGQGVGSLVSGIVAAVGGGSS